MKGKDMIFSDFLSLQKNDYTYFLQYVPSFEI